MAFDIAKSVLFIEVSSFQGSRLEGFHCSHYSTSPVAIGGATAAALNGQIARAVQSVPGNITSMGQGESRSSVSLSSLGGVEATDGGSKSKKGKKRPLSGYDLPEISESGWISDLEHPDDRYMYAEFVAKVVYWSCFVQVQQSFFPHFFLFFPYNVYTSDKLVLTQDLAPSFPLGHMFSMFYHFSSIDCCLCICVWFQIEGCCVLWLWNHEYSSVFDSSQTDESGQSLWVQWGQASRIAGTGVCQSQSGYEGPLGQVSTQSMDRVTSCTR